MRAIQILIEWIVRHWWGTIILVALIGAGVIAVGWLAWAAWGWVT